MVFKFTDHELKSRGFTSISLNALHPDDQEYSVLLNQYLGAVSADANFIGNSLPTHELAVSKFIAFADIAKDKGYDLVLSPEYSCPWKAIDAILNQAKLPEQGKLWILGCESITLENFKVFIDQHPQTVWIFEPEIFTTPTTKNFVDPVCHFFKALNGAVVVDVCVVQFKFQHMSVHLDYREKDHLIEGSVAYIFSNPGNTVNLITMICSESLVFDYNALLGLNLEKLLVIHLQMNLSPRHAAFKEYRNRIFNGESTHVELICLNWAAGTDILGQKILFAGSAYYLKSEKPVLKDSRLDHNQNNNLFYCFWQEKKTHAYYADSSELLIGFQTHKASQALVAATAIRRRDGPFCIETYSWKDEAYELNVGNNSFKDYCDSLGCDLAPLTPLGHTDKERLVRLSTGIGLNSKWHEVANFSFFHISNAEIINRITYTGEIDPDSIQGRKAHLMRLKELLLWFNNPTGLPKPLGFLVKDTRVSYAVEVNPFINVYATNTNVPVGTVVYIGPDVERQARKEFDNLKKLYLSTVNADTVRNIPAILVCYTDGVLKMVHDTVNLIDADVDEFGTAINKDPK
jgi:hypothetical protein